MLLAARLSRLGVCMVGALNSFSPARASMLGLRTTRFWVLKINLVDFTWSHQQLSKEHFYTHWQRRNCSGRQRKAMITFQRQTESVANCEECSEMIHFILYYALWEQGKSLSTYLLLTLAEHLIRSKGRMIIETTTPLLSATIQLLTIVLLLVKHLRNDMQHQNPYLP